MANDEKVNQQLEFIRQELLDIGLRGNTLLNFNPNANKKNIQVVDQKSAEIFNILVNEKKGMSFKPIPKKLKLAQGDLMSASDGFNQQLSQGLEEIYDDKRHTDTKLQTKFNTDELHIRLLRMQTETRSYIREQGIDVLYLALGFLEWYEDKAPEKPRKAPLILIPVSLQRETVRSQFKINYTEADLAPNLSLVHKLKLEFYLEAPDFETYIDINGNLDITSYFEGFSDCINLKQNWQINPDEIALGFFLFGQFKMFGDLDPQNWLRAKDSKVIQNLLGEDSEKENNWDGEDPNKYPELEAVDLHFVKDADPSQTKAILDVKQGANLVIHGPPGTGKSQTITNIISEALADNKTVLFVAEKMAALEVVKKRLDECKLGNSVLELHSTKGNKKAVSAELERTLELDIGTSNEVLSDFNRREYIRLRKQLDKYCEEIKQPLLNSGKNFVASLGRFIKLKRKIEEYKIPNLNIFDIKIPDFNFQKICNWKHEDFIEACTATREMSEHLNKMETVPEKSPFAESKLEDFSAEMAHGVDTIIGEALELLSECGKIWSNLSTNTSISIPTNISDIEGIMHTTNTPELDGMCLSDNELEENDTLLKIKELTITGEKMADLKSKHLNQVTEKAWTTELEVLREVWAKTGPKRMRFFSSEFRKAKRALKDLMENKLPGNLVGCLLLIDDILQYQVLYKKFAPHESLGKKLFGGQWSNEHNNWKELRKINQWLIDFIQKVNNKDLLKSLLRFLENGNMRQRYKEDIESLYEKSQIFESCIEQINKILVIGILEPKPSPLKMQSFQKLEEKLKSMHKEGGKLQKMVRYNYLYKKLRENKYEEIAQATYSWALPPDLLLIALQKTWFLGLLNEAYNKFDSLKQFDKLNHENTIKKFMELDKELLLHTQKFLEAEHLAKLEGINKNRGPGIKLITKEANKKARHIPIRELISRAGYDLQQIKPVFMMSPMSVATYLTKGAIDFDLVIFDEASQVKIPHAIGSIMRAKQVVMVGDTKQLPPTNFFQKSLEGEEGDYEDQSESANIDSILSMFLLKRAPQATLTWHYRSLDDSLIAISNLKFYKNKLIIFPNSKSAPDVSGLQLEHTSNSLSPDSTFPPSIYYPHPLRTNPVEAAKIAAAVMAHAKNTPEITLGVVAFSTAQRDCILEKIEWLRQGDQTCESFFNSNRLEDFFVKNLENVQGDERDAIFVSIGYGKDEHGKLNQNFGPLSKEGGEKRLNVLITRARKTMTVFSNFKGLDLRIDKKTKTGVKVLKDFLIYADTREILQIEETGRETDSPFEDEVILAIEQMGYKVEPQLGASGFYIDIAVIDPNNPGRYMLAVECDGATYHSSLHARARDRLRQNALEDRGWRFHRIWSTAWWNDQEEEMKSLKTSIEDSIKYYEEFDMDEES